jgi:photosystem II stability/assembly factor-like uncharacterized protein
MKKFFIFAVLFAAVAAAAALWTPFSNTLAQMDIPFFEREPDMPDGADQVGEIRRKWTAEEKQDYLIRRSEAYGLLRGIDGKTPVDPQLRTNAIKDREEAERTLARMPQSEFKSALTSSWSEIGPAPLYVNSVKYSGRATAIAVHPTNPNIVYVGTSQGGLYRTTNGGTTWTPLMDNALSLAIGSVAIAPSNPEIVYVGTGEQNFVFDAFFGVGVYRIENASTTATLVGPLNRDSANNDILSGRSVSAVVVHPADANTIFISTTFGSGGVGSAAPVTTPARGVFRSTNAASASPTFTRLTGLAAGADVSVRDIAIDPADPNILVAGVGMGSNIGAPIVAGIHRSADALSASPTFTRVLPFNTTNLSEMTTEFASMRPAGSPTAVFYAATGNLGGRVLRSNDGGVTWTQQIDNNFCTPQCFFDIAVAVSPADPNHVFLGGSPAVVSAFSTNGGVTFTEGGSGVHVDSHSLAVAPSNPSIVYLGTDGGIYKSINGGASYVDLNTEQFSAILFTGLAVHPTDPTITMGGTQDNGTVILDPNFSANWNRVDSFDGGNAVIDSNATSSLNFRMYHTRQNQTNQLIGYRTRGSLTESYVSRGCPNGVTPNNGINCNDSATMFYAPLETGPGNPNPIYYATDRVYRSTDFGVTHTVVSQAPITFGIPITSIGISPQNDNIRIFGMATGSLRGTMTGTSTLFDLDPNNQVPGGYISRTVIDPNNSNTAYVTISSFGISNVWKTTNLGAMPPTWTDISAQLPKIPVSAFLVDPADSNILYAGTDIGVYVSADGGMTWNPFGTGYPRVAVFDIAKTPGNTVRIASHGRGIWQIPAFSAAAIPVSISGRVTTPGGQSLRNATVLLTDSQGARRTATTSSFGLFTFAEVLTGQDYIITVASKRYRFNPQTLTVSGALSNVDFAGLE